MIMNNNALSQNMTSQDRRLFDGSDQLNANNQRMDSTTPVAAFLRGGAPAPGLMLPSGIGGSSLPSMSSNSNSMAAAMMNNMNNSAAAAAQMNSMNNLNSMNNNLNTMNNLNSINNMNSVNNLNLNDLKRLQQLHQLQNTSTNSLLVNPNARQQADPSAAILQSYLDQKVQTSRFDDTLRQSLGLGSGMGNGGMGNAMGSGMGAQQKNLMSTNLLQERLMMNQNGLNAASGNSNNAGGNGVPGELPLPSPHSLFNRDGSRRMRGGVIEPFPEKLHRLLMEVEAAGRSDVISFVANGRAFAIHKPDKFFKEIVPLYFRQSRLSSFKRQLNLYGFELINTGPARGGYYHELFVKDRPELCRRMRRVAVKVVSKGDDAPESPRKDSSAATDGLEKTDKLLRGGAVPSLQNNKAVDAE